MAWVAAVRRKNITFANISPFMYVCSRHFHKGQPAYEMMETDPDWAPSLHLGNTETIQTDTERFARQNKRAQKKKTARSAEGHGGQHTEETHEDNGEQHTEETHKDNGEQHTEETHEDNGEQHTEETPHNIQEVEVTQTECNMCVQRCAEINRLLEENGKLQCELNEYRMSDGFFGDNDDKKSNSQPLQGVCCQLAAKDVEETRKIAHLRIHVERVIGNVCQKYKILTGTVPINMILPCEGEDVTFLDKIVTVCCALTNQCPTVV
ncbi:hypothetical protein QQF64_034249 [Cirrhinus molitorella]|uniref:DDE Tnp4 domain-containing protein n=1 Tax=Cirrhinus molitorella TaxID=172907 RepID=A0ABR3MW43_9TELE